MSTMELGPDDDLVVITIPAGTSLLIGGEVEVQFKRTAKEGGAVLAIRKPKQMRVLRHKRSPTC